MTRILTALALLATLAVVGCGETSSSSSSSSSDRPGSPAVYKRIDTLKSCTKLQREFDTAMDNHDATRSDESIAYAEAAQKRIEALHC